MKTVENSLEIATTPIKVIQAFTEPDQLKAWWGVERTLVDRRPGGLYSLIWEIGGQGMGFVTSGIVRQYEPNGLFEVSDIVYFNPQRQILGPMSLRIIAKIKDGKTLLNIAQGGIDDGGDWDWYHEMVQHSWPKVIAQLKSYLESN